MRRRVLVIAAAGTAAAAGGGALWQWQSRTDPASAASPSLWALQFDRPDGTALAMSTLRGRPLLLNFWATWCPPCVRELPLIDQFQREQRARGWQVLGLAVDQRAPVLAFLKRQPVSFDVGLAGLEGTDLARSLGNTGGGLPFTIAFDRRGRIIERKLGALMPEDLARWAATTAA